MIDAYLAGLGLGLALIIPIGPQNLYVINAGLALGSPRVLAASLAATACDVLLIAIGAFGASAALTHIPHARTVLLIAGVVFLLYLGIQSLRAREPADDTGMQTVAGIGGTIRRVVGVSLLNPHAILDTTVTIGALIAARDALERLPFMYGAMSASLVWFLFIGVGASLVRSHMTPRWRLRIEWLSGIIMLFFAALLAAEVLLH